MAVEERRTLQRAPDVLAILRRHELMIERCASSPSINTAGVCLHRALDILYCTYSVRLLVLVQGLTPESHYQSRLALAPVARLFLRRVPRST